MTLMGVVVGTLGTILATQLHDRSQWTRALSVRWDERRIDAYAQFARALKEAQQVSYRLSAQDRPSLRAPAIDRDEGLALLSQAYIEHTKAWENVLLLGDAATVTAARGWRAAVEQLELSARGRPSEGFEWDSAVERMNEGRDRFYDAARASLAVQGGPIAQAAWLALRRDAA
jgi:hypothetical protein